MFHRQLNERCDLPKKKRLCTHILVNHSRLWEGCDFHFFIYFVQYIARSRLAQPQRLPSPIFTNSFQRTNPSSCRTLPQVFPNFFISCTDTFLHFFCFLIAALPVAGKLSTDPWWSTLLQKAESKSTCVYAGVRGRGGCMCVCACLRSLRVCLCMDLMCVYIVCMHVCGYLTLCAWPHTHTHTHKCTVCWLLICLCPFRLCTYIVRVHVCVCVCASHDVPGRTNT